MQLICNRVGENEQECEDCIHSKPHEEDGNCTHEYGCMISAYSFIHVQCVPIGEC